MGARARNVIQRPWRLSAIGVAAFLGVLAAYLFLPAGAQGVVRMLVPMQVARRDTTDLLRQLAARRNALAAADVELANRRSVHALILAQSDSGVHAPQADPRLDSITTLAGSLAALLERAESAPLPETFRALARSVALRDDPRVRTLVDSLDTVEREREELGGGATVDPTFVALTTQVNELGRRIGVLGRARLAALTRQVLAFEREAQGTTDARVTADTNASVVEDSQAVLGARESARRAYEAAESALSAARKANVRADSMAAIERRRLQLAPVPVLVAAATVIAVALAFALALLDEMRSPRVADSVEAERLTALRVLAVARRRSLPPDRTRRAADRQIPPVLDPTSDAYRVVAWHLASQWPRDGIVTVTGDDPLVSATVAANVAAVLANDARVTLLIDADLANEPVEAILCLPRSPGLAAVVQNRRKWSEALLPVPVGRGRTMDVLPAGGRTTPLGPAESQALAAEIQRAAKRQDATIVVTTLSGARRFRAGDDVIVCATTTHTRLATLARTVASLIDAGSRVRGVVLWDGARPTARESTRSKASAAA